MINMPHFKMIPIAWRLIFGNPGKVRHIIIELTACKEHGYHAILFANTNDERVMIEVFQEHLNALLIRNPPQ